MTTISTGAGHTISAAHLDECPHGCAGVYAIYTCFVCKIVVCEVPGYRNDEAGLCPGLIDWALPCFGKPNADADG